MLPRLHPRDRDLDHRLLLSGTPPDELPPARSVVREPAVRVGRHDFDRADLVLVGFVDGSWPALERSVAAGLAAERTGGPADPGALRDAAVAFRRARGLLAADELDAWLDAHDVSRDDLTGYLRRRVLRESVHMGLDPVPVEDVAAVLEVEAACDGILATCADSAASWAAAAQATGLPDTTTGDEAAVATVAGAVAASAASLILDLDVDDLLRRIDRLLGLRAAYDRFVTAVTGDDAIRDCLAAHQLDWLRVRAVELTFDDEGAAEEGAMCLCEDKLAPEEVARLAGAQLAERTVALDGATPELAALLVSARPGDVVGPVVDPAGRHRLLVVADRLPPAADDPAMRERAGRELVAAALEPVMAGAVRRHAAL